MSDPRRLLDDAAQLSDEEQRLLAAGMQAAPPEALGAEVWAGLAAKLPPTGGNGGTPQGANGGSGAAAGGSTTVQGAGALLLKAGLAAIAVGALLLGGRALLRREVSTSASRSALSHLASAAIPSSVPLPAASFSAEQPPPRAPAPVAPLSASASHVASVQHAKGGSILPAPVASSSFASDASEESRAVTAARDALRSGNTGGALSLLAQAQRRFGAGALGQEREALSIEALAKSGQHSAAHTRGELFLKNYAHSPYAARIRALIGSN